MNSNPNNFLDPTTKSNIRKRNAHFGLIQRSTLRAFLEQARPSDSPISNYDVNVNFAFQISRAYKFQEKDSFGWDIGFEEAKYVKQKNNNKEDLKGSILWGLG